MKPLTLIRFDCSRFFLRRHDAVILRWHAICMITVAIEQLHQIIIRQLDYLCCMCQREGENNGKYANNVDWTIGRPAEHILCACCSLKGSQIMLQSSTYSSFLLISIRRDEEATAWCTRFAAQPSTGSHLSMHCWIVGIFLNSIQCANYERSQQAQRNNES